MYSRRKHMLVACMHTLILGSSHTTLCSTGDVNSGKSVLVDKLCQISKSFPIGGKFPLSSCSLEYRFIDVQDEETDGM